MAILYTTGVIRATKKFRTVMLTLFGTMIGISILTFIGLLVDQRWRAYRFCLTGGHIAFVLLTVAAILPLYTLGKNN